MKPEPLGILILLSDLILYCKKLDEYRDFINISHPTIWKSKILFIESRLEMCIKGFKVLIVKIVFLLCHKLYSLSELFTVTKNSCCLNYQKI